MVETAAPQANNVYNRVTVDHIAVASLTSLAENLQNAGLCNDCLPENTVAQIDQAAGFIQANTTGQIPQHFNQQVTSHTTAIGQ